MHSWAHQSWGHHSSLVSVDCVSKIQNGCHERCVVPSIYPLILCKVPLSPLQPSRDITQSLFMISNVIFQVEPKSKMLPSLSKITIFLSMIIKFHLQTILSTKVQFLFSWWDLVDCNGNMSFWSDKYITARGIQWKNIYIKYCYHKPLSNKHFPLGVISLISIPIESFP